MLDSDSDLLSGYQRGSQRLRKDISLPVQDIIQQLQLRRPARAQTCRRSLTSLGNLLQSSDSPSPQSLVTSTLVRLSIRLQATLSISRLQITKRIMKRITKRMKMRMTKTTWPWSHRSKWTTTSGWTPTSGSTSPLTTPTVITKVEVRVFHGWFTET